MTTNYRMLEIKLGTITLTGHRWKMTSASAEAISWCRRCISQELNAAAPADVEALLLKNISGLKRCRNDLGGTSAKRIVEQILPMILWLKEHSNICQSFNFYHGESDSCCTRRYNLGSAKNENFPFDFFTKKTMVELEIMVATDEDGKVLQMRRPGSRWVMTDRKTIVKIDGGTVTCDYLSQTVHEAWMLTNQVDAEDRPFFSSFIDFSPEFQAIALKYDARIANWDETGCYEPSAHALEQIRRLEAKYKLNDLDIDEGANPRNWIVVENDAPLIYDAGIGWNELDAKVVTQTLSKSYKKAA